MISSASLSFELAAALECSLHLIATRLRSYID